MDANLPARVVELVSEHSGIPADKLHAETRLEEDLRMTGDDAAEFLDAFAAAFDVDFTGIEFHKHFGPECGGPIFLWPKRLKDALKDHGQYPVTIGHLVEVAQAKRWVCPPLRGSKQ